MFELIFSISVVILISALCSLFEAIFFSVPISHIETLAQDGNPSGQIFRKLRKNVDRPISAILSLNTIANTGGAAIAGAAFAKVYPDHPKVFFTLAITLSVLLFSEVIPKTIGMVYNRPLSSLIARPLQILVWIFIPFIELCRIATRLIAGEQKEQDISDQELISLAQLGQRTGAIAADEARVIQNILSLKSKTAWDVMTPRTVVFALNERLSVEEAHTEAGLWSHGRVPIYDKDFEDIVGIVLRKDVLSALAEEKGQNKLWSLMRPVHFVSESTSLDRILKMFLERRQHLFIVIDEYGGLTGVLTLEDVLEEILGKEIVDELDQVADLRELARRRRQQIYQHPNDN